MTNGHLMCAYCAEPATELVFAEGNPTPTPTCDDHEERAVIEAGDGWIEDLPSR